MGEGTLFPFKYEGADCMSDALTAEAPAEEPAAPSVETSAPGSEAAADGGSAGGEEVIPASRFNGLMASMNRQKSEYEAQLQAMQAELESLRQAEETETEPVADTALADELRETREALQSVVLERARDKALDKYPEAKPFADLIFGGSADEIEEVARVVAERAKLVAPEPTAATEAEEEPEIPAAEAGEEAAPATPGAETEPPEAPVVGGAVATAGSDTFNDAVTEALESKDLHAFLVAKSQQQAANTTVE